MTGKARRRAAHLTAAALTGLLLVGCDDGGESAAAEPSLSASASGPTWAARVSTLFADAKAQDGASDDYGDAAVTYAAFASTVDRLDVPVDEESARARVVAQAEAVAAAMTAADAVPAFCPPGRSSGCGPTARTSAGFKAVDALRELEMTVAALP